jgi:hypothetical protein
VAFALTLRAPAGDVHRSTASRQPRDCRDSPWRLA